MNYWREEDGILALRGRGLRFVMLEKIRRRKVMTVAELVQVLRAEGYELGGRESKVVSDALRWEVARGRVIRRSRGVYAYGKTPPSTARRIRIFARQCHAWIVATTRSEQPPPTAQVTPDRLTSPPTSWYAEDPYRPPWQSLVWLWAL